MVNLKTTINYNNILIKAQLKYIVTVSVSETLVLRGQTLFRAGRYRLQSKHPLSEGLAQFTDLKFTRATSGR